MGKKELHDAFPATVIVTVCGNFDSFSDCLRSLLEQSIKKLEIIVIDSDRREETKKTLRKLQRKNRKIVYAAMPNTSESEKRNFGLSAAKGKYIAWIDANIRYAPDALSFMIGAAQDNEADVVLVRAGGIDVNNAYSELNWTVNEDFLPSQDPHIGNDCECSPLLYCYGWTSDKLFRRAFLIDKQCLFPAIQAFSDIPFTYQALCVGNTFVLNQTCVYTVCKEKIAFAHNPSGNAIDCFFALKALKESLERSDVFKSCERAYMSWGIQFVVWCYRTTREEAKEHFRKVLRELIEPYLQITEHGADHYFTRKRYFKYAELCSEDDAAKVLRKLHEIDRMNCKALSIWGCCISREFLNVEKEAVYVNGYIFQCPINIYYDCLSVYRKKIPYQVFNDAAPSTLWARNAYISYNKLPLENLKTHPSDYLIVDFGDVRFDQYVQIEREDKQKTKVLVEPHTKSCLKTCVEKGYIHTISYENWFKDKKHIIEKKDWDKILEQFVQDIQKFYPNRRIIINQTRFAQKYSDGLKFYDFEETSYAKKEIIGYLEQKMIDLLPGCRFIPLPENVYSTTFHPLKLLKLHYCRTAYEYQMQALKKIVNEHATNEQIAELCKKCEEQLQKELEEA